MKNNDQDIQKLCESQVASEAQITIESIFSIKKMIYDYVKSVSEKIASNTKELTEEDYRLFSEIFINVLSEYIIIALKEYIDNNEVCYKIRERNIYFTKYFTKMFIRKLNSDDIYTQLIVDCLIINIINIIAKHKKSNATIAPSH